MNTVLDCIPCITRQALEVARLATDDPTVHEKLMRNVLRVASEMDLRQPPPRMAQKVHRILRDLTGIADPYRADKERFNRMALEMLPALSTAVEQSTDPLATALRYAIAGNMIDLGVKGDIPEDEAGDDIHNVMDEPFYGDIEAFRQAADAAKQILYLADNAGEIVLDRLLIEQLPTGRVVVAVRGEPVLNDATLADAEVAGLCDLVEVIGNGSDAPGTVLADCSEEFRLRFAQADMIISKGQGNLETLTEEPANIWFLLKAKCTVIARRLGVPVGTHVAIPRDSLPPVNNT